jgi:hypothetical protein
MPGAATQIFSAEFDAAGARLPKNYPPSCSKTGAMCTGPYNYAQSY